MSRTTAKKQRDKEARYALTFGLESDAVRQGPCVSFRTIDGPGNIIACRVRQAVIDDELTLVWDPAHVVSVGADGTKHDLVSLCSAHHQQQHRIGVETFAAMYGLDLRALADAQALAHEPPLGIRGLAARWAASKVVPRVFDSTLLRSPAGAGDGTTSTAPPLVGYDLAALMGWTRRRMAAELAKAAAVDRSGARLGFCDPHGHLTEVIGSELELDDERLSHAEYLDRAWTLCEQAGWPS